MTTAPLRPSPRSDAVAKRTLDVVGATLALLCTAPCLVAAAVLVKCEDGGPILYRRRVLGRAGVQFHAFKLRSMREDADAWLASHEELATEYQRNIKLRHDPRVTRIGRLIRKLSVDELPQLVNVLRGEMSLVGPRIIHPAEGARFGDFLATRSTVRPGITGLWQVEGRQDVDYASRAAFDRRYIEQRSFRLDLIILLRTIPSVVIGRGAW